MDIQQPVQQQPQLQQQQQPLQLSQGQPIQPQPIIVQQPTTPQQQQPPVTIPAAAPSQPPQPQVCNNVVIPIPIAPPEDIYTYVVVKGSLHAQDCAIFGLNEQEIAAFTKRYTNGSTNIVNGILIKIPPLQAINSLSQLGYKIICSTGEAEIVWTMQREL